MTFTVPLHANPDGAVSSFSSLHRLGADHEESLADAVRKEVLLFGNLPAARIFAAEDPEDPAVVSAIACLASHSEYEYFFDDSTVPFPSYLYPSNVTPLRTSFPSPYFPPFSITATITPITPAPTSPPSPCPPLPVQKTVPVDGFLAYARLQYSHYGNFTGELYVDAEGRGEGGGFVVRYGNSERSDSGVVPTLRPYLVSSPPPSLEPSPSSIPSGQPTATVLLVDHDDGSNTTASVFTDVTTSLLHHLSLLNYSPVLLRCPALSLPPCAASSLATAAAAGPLIAVAPHTLTRVETSDGSPLVLQSPSVLPPTTVLYNYEVIPPLGPPTDGSDHVSFADADYIELCRRHTVWDYSSSNVARLREREVSAALVPLGYSQGLEGSGWPAREGLKKDISVLFYGTMTKHRRNVVRQLRSFGIVVHVPTTSTWGVYHSTLDDLISRAEIVLNLNTWENEGEWKMTRFGRLLAAGAFVVSEPAGGGEEEVRFGDGIVFCDTVERMRDVIVEHLGEGMKEERRRVGELGRNIFMEEDMEGGLRRALAGSGDNRVEERSTGGEEVLRDGFAEPPSSPVPTSAQAPAQSGVLAAGG